MKLNCKIPWTFAAITLICSSNVLAQIINDLTVRYSYMKITEAQVGGLTKKPTFYRNYLDLEFGRGQTTFGFTFQKTGKSDETQSGKKETGLMLTATHDYILSNSVRIQGYGRLSLTGNDDDAQPLYATDTDLRFNVIAFDKDGFGLLNHKSFYPSGYVGGVVNRYGRVQAIAGAGLWWNYVGIYVTGFHAFNGVDDPFNPGDDLDNRFANLKNRGYSVDVSYEWNHFKLAIKQNFAIKNSGNDLSISLQYIYTLGGK